MIHTSIPGVPDFEEIRLQAPSSKYCLLIPVINEGSRIQHELERAHHSNVDKMCDIIICDGGSTDGSLSLDFLRNVGVNTLLIKQGPGKQGAQLRTGIYTALERNYEGVITVDGNDKDSVESVPLFIEALEAGYGFVQGSRFIPGGQAINTPLLRLLALRLIHAPVTSLAARAHFTDTTNAFRAYSAEYLRDIRLNPLRDIFSGYELLAYLAVRASQIGYRTIEVPVTRSYPATGETPTKISGINGNFNLLAILFRAAFGRYNPKEHH